MVNPGPSKVINTISCPCESNLNYEQCCAPFLQGIQHPKTAEQLMRSRYTAYVYNNIDYLLLSWHDSTRPKTIDLQPEIKWLGLKIISTDAGQEQDSNGTVEFVARNKLAGRAFRLHEKSQFIRENDRWFYLDGEYIEK